MRDWNSQTSASSGKADASHSCYCVGPKNGEPYCPCRMKNVIQRDGRWIELEKDLGPAVTKSVSPTRKCPNCKQGYWSAKFCPECGTKVEPINK